MYVEPIFHKNMLKEFENWFLTNQTLSKKELTVKMFKPSKTENTGVYADIMTDKIYARAIIWESQELQLEAIDTISEEIVIFDYHNVKNKLELETLLQNFIARIIEYN